jgi:hypothetical protein
MSKRITQLSELLILISILCFQLSSAPARGNTPETESSPDADVKQFQFDDLERYLRTMPHGPEHDYFAGVLANAENRIAESIQLLAAVLPSLREGRPDRAAIVLQTLADDYTKSFQYAKATQTDDDLLTHFSSQLTHEQIQQTRDDSAIMHILRDAPTQTIVWNGTVELKTERNPINSLNIELTVNGVRGPWLVDTGANLSLVSESFAQRLGLKPLPGIAQTQGGLTGIENPVHVALLPTLAIGDAELHNVVVMILPDANININLGKASYQINAIVGYPVLKALGTVTFTHDGKFRAGKNTTASETGARMYMKGLTPVVMCQTKRKALPFGFDTGASSTNFFARYSREFHDRTWKKDKSTSVGAGGTLKRNIYIQPRVELGFGEKTATLKNVVVFTTGTGTDTDYLYGNLGQDVPADFESFTLDFTKMSFSLGAPLPKSQNTEVAKPTNESPVVKPYQPRNSSQDKN